LMFFLMQPALTVAQKNCYNEMIQEYAIW